MFSSEVIEIFRANYLNANAQLQVVMDHRRRGQPLTSCTAWIDFKRALAADLKKKQLPPPKKVDEKAKNPEKPPKKANTSASGK